MEQQGFNWKNLLNEYINRNLPDGKKPHEDVKATGIAAGCVGEILTKLGSAFVEIEGEPQWTVVYEGMFDEQMQKFFKKCHDKPEMGLQCLHYMCRGIPPLIWDMRAAEGKRWKDGDDDGEETQKKRRQNIIFLEMLFDMLHWTGFVALYKAKELRNDKTTERKDWIKALRYTADSVHTVGLQLLAGAKGMLEDGGMQLSDRIRKAPLS